MKAIETTSSPRIWNWTSGNQMRFNLIELTDREGGDIWFRLAAIFYFRNGIPASYYYVVINGWTKVDTNGPCAWSWFIRVTWLIIPVSLSFFIPPMAHFPSFACYLWKIPQTSFNPRVIVTNLTVDFEQTLKGMGQIFLISAFTNYES